MSKPKRYRCYGCKHTFKADEVERVTVEGHRYHSQGCALGTVFSDGKYHMLVVVKDVEIVN